MKVKGKINNISFNIKGEPILSIEIYEKNTLLREYETLEKEDVLSIEIKKHKNKRSLNANNYCWALINELGNAMNLSKDEVYLLMLKSYGQNELVSILSNINVAGYFKYYEVAGTTMLNNKEFTHYRIYKGSSEYDTKEMAILIDGIVSECQELGIETLTPDELDKLKSEWVVS